mmetsp:Transcript_40948/g.67184  ORF Transcript_40948/g.67184 Transcript_40948/m.67184 type:complete len:98 (-) Transcript_40948:403-696(-)
MQPTMSIAATAQKSTPAVTNRGLMVILNSTRPASYITTAFDNHMPAVDTTARSSYSVESTPRRPSPKLSPSTPEKMQNRSQLTAARHADSAFSHEAS